MIKRQPTSPPRIDSLGSLRTHLQDALALEHATIPPYFTAWLSIKEGANREAAEIIRSVMLEEMLHMTLVANLLNAVGGKPALTSPDFVANYPCRLPHSGARFDVGIEKFSRSALQTFLKIERPEPRGAQPKADHWDTIGQFYQAIEQAFVDLCELDGAHNVFRGDPARQIGVEHYYGAGKIVKVTDLASARAAIEEIVEQGEGVDHTMFDRDQALMGEGRELAHYFRFMEVMKGRHYLPSDSTRHPSLPHGPPLPVDFTRVWPIAPNAKLEDYDKHPDVRRALERFAAGYRDLLAALEDAFNGESSRFQSAIAMMFGLKYQALALIRTPSPVRRGATVGPCFRAAPVPAATAVKGGIAERNRAALADVERVIGANLDAFRKPGVISVRPGYKVSGGWLMQRPAIVVTVTEKNDHPRMQDMIPARVGGYQTDVRAAAPMQLLRHTDPARHAVVTASGRPEHAEPVFSAEVSPHTGAAVGGPPQPAKPWPKLPKVPYTPAPGASLRKVTGKMSLICHVGPDAAWSQLSAFLKGVRERLTVGMYDFTSAHVLAAVKAALGGDRTLSLVLDHPSLDASADQTDEDTDLALRKALGAREQFAWAAAGGQFPMVTRAIFATSYHIKVAVRDGASFWLSSGNWNNSNQADIDPFKNKGNGIDKILNNSDRDWDIIVEHAGLSKTFEACLVHDRQQALRYQSRAPVKQTTVVPPEPRGEARVPKRFFKPQRFANVTVGIQPLLTPDQGAGNYASGVTALIGSAKQRLFIQTQYIQVPYPDQAEPFHELVAALAKKIAAGLDVRIILSQYATTPWLEKAQQAGIPATHIRIQQNVHNKGIVVDSKVVMVGSQNWSTDGVLYNRDASLIIQDAKAARYYEQVFLHDWENMAVQQVPHYPREEYAKVQPGAKARPRTTPSKGTRHAQRTGR